MPMEQPTTRDEYERVERERHALRVADAHQRRKHLVPYNTTFKEAPFLRGNATSTNLLPIPALGCLVGRNDTGYGDCSMDTWIVKGVRYTKATGQMCALSVVRVYGLDVGIGDADAMPEHPGQAAIEGRRGDGDEDEDDDEERKVELTVRWSQGEVEWKEYNKKYKWWTNASWTVGKYIPSCAGIDK